MKKRDDEMTDRESLDYGAKHRLLCQYPEEEGFQEDDNNLPTKMSLDGANPNLAFTMQDGANGRTKRSKKAGANSPSLGSAGSLDGSVRPH
jgi:hypothetical protein